MRVRACKANFCSGAPDFSLFGCVLIGFRCRAIEKVRVRACRPGRQSTNQASSKPASQPAGQAATWPSRQQASQPVSQPVAQPVIHEVSHSQPEPPMLRLALRIVCIQAFFARLVLYSCHHGAETEGASRCVARILAAELAAVATPEKRGSEGVDDVDKCIDRQCPATNTNTSAKRIARQQLVASSDATC